MIVATNVEPAPDSEAASRAPTTVVVAPDAAGELVFLSVPQALSAAASAATAAMPTSRRMSVPSSVARRGGTYEGQLTARQRHDQLQVNDARIVRGGRERPLPNLWS